MFWTLIMRLLDSLWGRLQQWELGLHLLCRSYFLPLMKKKMETVLYFLRKERACRALWQGTLVSPLPLYANFKNLSTTF